MTPKPPLRFANQVQVVHISANTSEHSNTEDNNTAQIDADMGIDAPKTDTSETPDIVMTDLNTVEKETY